MLFVKREKPNHMAPIESEAGPFMRFIVFYERDSNIRADQYYAKQEQRQEPEHLIFRFSQNRRSPLCTLPENMEKLKPDDSYVKQLFEFICHFRRCCCTDCPGMGNRKPKDGTASIGVIGGMLPYIMDQSIGSGMILKGCSMTGKRNQHKSDCCN